jgi:hypothetical protein
MNSFDYFCDFAWGHLCDVFDQKTLDAISCSSPYPEFLTGCAACSLFNLTEEEQLDQFGFTLGQVISRDDEAGDFALRFLMKYRQKRNAIKTQNVPPNQWFPGAVGL